MKHAKILLFAAIFAVFSGTHALAANESMKKDIFVQEEVSLTPAVKTAIKDLKKWPKNARAAYLICCMPECDDFLGVKNSIASRSATFMSLDKKLYNWWDAKHTVPNERWNAVANTIKEEHHDTILRIFSGEVKRIRQYNGLDDIDKQ